MYNGWHNSLEKAHGSLNTPPTNLPCFYRIEFLGVEISLSRSRDPHGKRKKKGITRCSFLFSLGDRNAQSGVWADFTRRDDRFPFLCDPHAILEHRRDRFTGHDFYGSSPSYGIHSMDGSLVKGNTCPRWNEKKEEIFQLGERDTFSPAKNLENSLALDTLIPFERDRDVYVCIEGRRIFRGKFIS